MPPQETVQLTNKNNYWSEAHQALLNLYCSGGHTDPEDVNRLKNQLKTLPNGEIKSLLNDQTYIQSIMSCAAAAS